MTDVVNIQVNTEGIGSNAVANAAADADDVTASNEAVAESASLKSPTRNSVRPYEKELETSTKICISNVCYSTREQDLLDFFSDYKVGFRGPYHKSMGIAYVIFPDHDTAVRVVEEVNGKELDGRSLRIKLYTSYHPRYHRRSQKVRRSKHRRSKNVDSIDKENEEPIIVDGNKPFRKEEEGPEIISAGNDEGLVVKRANSANKTGNNGSKPVKSVEFDVASAPEISKDTVFVTKLHPRISDEDFEPSDIYILDGSLARRFRFSQRRVSALVTLKKENGQVEAIEKLSGMKLNGKGVIVRPAFVSKVDHVMEKLKKQKEREEKEKEDDKEKEDNREEENENGKDGVAEEKDRVVIDEGSVIITR